MKDGESVFSMTKAYEKPDIAIRERERERTIGAEELVLVGVPHRRVIRLFLGYASLPSYSPLVFIILVVTLSLSLSHRRFASCGVFSKTSPPIDDVYDAMPLQLLCEEISHLTHTHTHTLTHTMTRAGAALIACVTMVPKDPQKGNGQLLSYRLPRRRPRLEVLVLAA